MQLKIQRSQRAGGLVGNTVFFCLDVRADYSPEERDNIRKYKLGGQIIYNSQAARRHLENAGAHLDRTQAGDFKERASGLARGALSLALAKMQLSISIGSLRKGHRVECKDLQELLEAEDAIRSACKDLTRYLDVADTFNGSEVVITYEKGEERVHIARNAPPLLEYQPQGALSVRRASAPTVDLNKVIREWARKAKDAWLRVEPKVRAWVARARTAWLAMEDKVIGLASKKGWTISGVQVRAACVGMALVLAVALFVLL